MMGKDLSDKICDRAWLLLRTKSINEFRYKLWRNDAKIELYYFLCNETKWGLRRYINVR